MFNENMSEGLAVMGWLAPASQTVGTKTVGPFNTQLMRRVIFFVECGALGGTVDFKVQASATQGGTYADVSGTTVTQVTTGATNLLIVEVSETALMSAGQGPWLKGVLTIGTGASQGSVLALGGSPRYSPASDYSNVAATQTLVAN